MKLWLIIQDKNNNYDTYDSAVVASETKGEAKLMHPKNGKDIRGDVREKSEGYSWDSWVKDPNDVKCFYIGEAKKGTKKGVICASFNSG